MRVTLKKMQDEKIVPCPTCKGDSVYGPNNPWRPFCCERCRQIDLGAWASESFRVEATPPADPDEQNNALN